MVVNSFNQKEKGFTLVELLVVCVILGVLAAAIIPNLAKFIGSGTEGASSTEMATVKNGVTCYLVDNGGALPCTVHPTVGNPQPLIEALIEPYIANAPVRAGYLVEVDGVVVGDPAHPYPGLTWDAVRGIWTKQ